MSVFGPGLTLLLLALTPLLVSMPVALAMAEMASALPEEGGYVAWVRRAFGPFWSFQVGWWSWLNSFVDVAVYPALFADYLRFWRPEMTAVERWLLALGFVWLLTAVNLSGVRVTGWGAVALSAGALAPIVVLAAAAASHAGHAPWSPFAAPGQGLWSGLGVGIAVMMWNYSGWDTPSTVLGETSHAGASYRRALWWALPLIALAYIVPVAAGLAATGDWQRWQTGHWPVVAAPVGGPWLAGAVAAGAVTATAGLFLSLVLTNSRLPYALARAGPAASLAGGHASADRRALGRGAPVERRLQRLRALVLQRAHRAERLALLAHAPARARRIRRAAPARAGAAAPVARGRRRARASG